jgi:signal recognition particle subunit SRP54
MVLDKLGDALKGSLRKLTGKSFIDEKAVNELVKEIQRSLLQADVNVKLVFEVTKKIKERALSEKAPSILEKKEFIVNIVYEELVAFLGGEHEAFNVESKKPFKLMLVGLFR